MWGLVNALVVF